MVLSLAISRMKILDSALKCISSHTKKGATRRRHTSNIPRSRPTHAWRADQHQAKIGFSGSSLTYNAACREWRRFRCFECTCAQSTTRAMFSKLRNATNFVRSLIGSVGYTRSTAIGSESYMVSGSKRIRDVWVMIIVENCCRDICIAVTEPLCLNPRVIYLLYSQPGVLHLRCTTLLHRSKPRKN